MQITANMKRLITVHMQFLDCGMVTEAKEVASLLSDMIEDDKKDFSEPVVKRIKKFEKISRSIGNSRVVLNKTTETLRNILLHDILKQLGSKKKCMHCKEKFEKVQSFKTKLMRTVKNTDDAEEGTIKLGGIKIVTPRECRDYLRSIWLMEQQALLEIVPVLKGVKDMEFPTDVFFLDVVAVLPSNVRPISYTAGMMTEHSSTQLYRQLLECCLLLRAVIQVMKGGEIELPEEARLVYESAAGSTPAEKLHLAWQQLQTSVDSLMDRELSNSTGGAAGLKQIIEKKQGVIRMHMMGKRVNFAARSVITPDPNLAIDEIGIPEEFARQLSYPVPVTSWNVEELRRLVTNGPRVHPGATTVEFGGRTLRIDPENPTQQESIFKRLLTPEEGGGVKIVHRHLQNGDILLLNRQPTLHRPSIMAHVARVLPNEKTIRLHYANCKAYNADFDGDEMNAHFPQNEVARSEAYELAIVGQQYLVPKDGTPLLGLIQDHVVAGVRLTARGSFFSSADYQQLVYTALDGCRSSGRLRLLPPAMMRPRRLWTGKQILSTVLLNVIPADRRPLHLCAPAKISARAWGYRGPPHMSEAEVVIRDGELVCGVFDKQQLGATPHGLVHCVYELYGSRHATRLLSALARLLTAYLQLHGFTLGVRDILVVGEAERERCRLVDSERQGQLGREATRLALDLPADQDYDIESLGVAMEAATATNARFIAHLDHQYKSQLDRLTDSINKACLPAGLLEPFPDNNLQLMVTSGAKGSTVNTMQISCLLGQIELEGKRPARMPSGRSLPCFIAGDTSPRAGGFIAQRFMTGIRPPEFFFHCMAGREGLIDTAVKTSRSGYLQRCLVKHLEGLRVAYDLTVRDSDNSLVQFLYGEDGMDIANVQFLNERQLPFLRDNAAAVDDAGLTPQLRKVPHYKRMLKHAEKLNRWKEANGNPLDKRRRTAFSIFSEVMCHRLDLEQPHQINKKTGRTQLSEAIVELWRRAGPDIRASFETQCTRCPDPINSCYQPDHYLGALPDRLAELLAKHGADSEDALHLKAMRGVAAAGESVGLLAAQSIGEPSTQMTLNTFHFAGRGEMNVTLGIPRLREILMMASTNIKTPSMEVPFLKGSEDQAERLRCSLTRVTLADVLERVEVTTRLQVNPPRQHVYVLTFHFLPHHLYQYDLPVSPRSVLKHMTRKYFGQLFTSIRKITRITTGHVQVKVNFFKL